MRFRLIDAEKAGLPLERLCALLDVSVSGYYAWKHCGPSRRQLDDMVLLAHIILRRRTAPTAVRACTSICVKRVCASVATG